MFGTAISILFVIILVWLIIKTLGSIIRTLILLIVLGLFIFFFFGKINLDALAPSDPNIAEVYSNDSLIFNNTPETNETNQSQEENINIQNTESEPILILLNNTGNESLNETPNIDFV